VTYDEALAAMTDEEQVKVVGLVDKLHEHGYQDLALYGAELRVGTRIRHRGQQYPEAYDHGTGYVVALTEKRESAWSETYRMDDVELVAVFDEPFVFSRVSQLAHYHVSVVSTSDGAR
jgi:hypothetical protein